MTEIKRATTHDIPDIQSVAAVTFPLTYRDIITPEQTDFMMEWMYSTESLRRQMEQEHHTYYILYEEGRPTGYVSIQPQGEGVFHLQKIYVLPYRQGCGFGAMLFRRAVAAVREMHPGPCVMELNVNRHNRAVAFYERMGMHKDREGDFPIGNGFYMNDYIMAMNIGGFSTPPKEEL